MNRLVEQGFVVSIANVVGPKSFKMGVHHLGIKEQEIVEVLQEEVCTIRTRKGSEVIETPIPCTN